MEIWVTWMARPRHPNFHQNLGSNFRGRCQQKKTRLPHKTVANLLYPGFNSTAATANNLNEDPETERLCLSWLMTGVVAEVSVSHPHLVVQPG